MSSSVWEEKSNVMSHWLIDWTSGHWDVHLTRTATNPSFINYVNYDVGDHTDVDVFHETIGAIYLRIYAHNISSAYSIMCSKPLSFSVSWLWGMNISLTTVSLKPQHIRCIDEIQDDCPVIVGLWTRHRVRTALKMLHCRTKNFAQFFDHRKKRSRISDLPRTLSDKFTFWQIL